MPDFHALIDSWNSPPTRHAMLVHLPIVLTIVGAVLALLAAILTRNKTLRTLAIVCQIAVIAAAFMTANSGEHAADAAGNGGIVLTRQAEGILSDHEEMADKVWMFGAGCLLLTALATAIRKPALSITFGWLAFLACAATVLWVGKTANYGGELVYHYGVGTPHPVVRENGAEAASQPPTRLAATAPSPTQPRATRGAPSQTPAANTTPASAPVLADERPADPVKVAFFREKVYPILSENCFTCHNPNRARRSGGLDQSTRETILKGGRSGPAITPGKPDDSLLVHRIRGDIPDKRIMPPSGQLSDEQISTIAQWIQDGAVWGESRE